MSKYIGDYDTGGSVRFSFNTQDPTGAAITLAGTPVISVYKSGSTNEVTTGVTLTTDYDSRTGLHHVLVDMSSDGTFYAAGSDFRAVITTGTVNGISVVGKEVAHWSIRNRSAQALQDGAITAAKIGANAITAAKVATDAFGSDQIAASAVTKIQNGLATSLGLAGVATNVSSLVLKLTGITSLARWLGIIAGSGDDATTLAEINATPAGDGYNNVNASQQKNAAEIALVKARTENLPDEPMVNTHGKLWALDTDGNPILTLSDVEGAVGGVTPPAVSVVIPGEVVQASQENGQITVYTYNTNIVTLPLMGDISGREKLWFTVKASAADADSAAILQITESGGLAVVNGETAPVGDDSAMTVIDEDTGEVSIELSDEVMVLLANVHGGEWDAKWLKDGRTFPPVGGRITFVSGITRAIG